MQCVKWEICYCFMVFSIAGKIISACHCMTGAESKSSWIVFGGFLAIIAMVALEAMRCGARFRSAAIRAHSARSSVARAFRLGSAGVKFAVRG